MKEPSDMTPKERIAALDKAAARTDARLSAIVDVHERRLATAIADLEKRIVDMAIGIDRKGAKGATWTITQAQEMHASLIREFAAIYGEAAAANVGDFDAIARKLIPGYFGEIGVPVAFTRADRALLTTLRDTSFRVYQTLGDAAVNRIAQAVYGQLVAGATRGALVREITAALEGYRDVKGRPLAIYAKTYAQDSVMQAYRTMHATKAEFAGLDHWRYVGTIKEASGEGPGTRPFCRRMLAEGGSKSAEEIAEIDKETWDGKSGPTLTNAGGYNCRHHWQAVRPEWLETGNKG